MIRNLTPEEQDELHRHCIFCKQDLVYPGPVGGVSLNIYCCTCLAGFNITHPKLPWQLIFEPGERKPEDLLGIVAPAMKLNQLVEELSENIERGFREVFKRMHRE